MGPTEISARGHESVRAKRPKSRRERLGVERPSRRQRLPIGGHLPPTFASKLRMLKKMERWAARKAEGRYAFTGRPLGPPRRYARLVGTLMEAIFGLPPPMEEEPPDFVNFGEGPRAREEKVYCRSCNRIYYRPAGGNHSCPLPQHARDPAGPSGTGVENKAGVPPRPQRRRKAGAKGKSVRALGLLTTDEFGQLALR